MRVAIVFSLVAACIAQRQNNNVPKNARCLKQAQFEMGTLVISEPGNYKLCEDISFGPNGPSCDPIFDDGYYSRNNYGLGFFAAIAITTSDVKLFLNGHTIEQTAEHALLQRFFSVIELANSPFIESVGPAQFVGETEWLSPASNVEIVGPGTIGRSSHHGIHGNDNTQITIKNVIFRDFEVAAVSLNNADDVKISNCEITNNRHDVPIVGLFSAARFLRPYGEILKDMNYAMDIRGERTSAQALYYNLLSSISNVYDDVLLGTGNIDETKHPKEYELFHNPFGVIDGPCYAFVVHGKGPAVGGQGENFNTDDDTVTSSNIVIQHNNITNLKCWNNEVPAVVESGTVMNDARGAILQLVSTFNNESPLLAINEDGTYKGNVVADLQIMVASAILDGTLQNIPERQTIVNTISQPIIDWAKSGTAIYHPLYRCNGDSMHHVVKGIIVIRVEDTEGFFIRNNRISDISNLSVEPFGVCEDYHQGASSENENEQQAGNIRGISVAAVRGFDEDIPGIRDDGKSAISSNDILNLTSNEANVIIGIDVQGDSKDVIVARNVVSLKDGVGEDPDDEYISIRFRGFVDTRGRDRVAARNNILSQEAQFEENIFARNRNIRALKELHGHISGDIEWKTGGCPFASQMVNAK